MDVCSKQSILLNMSKLAERSERGKVRIFTTFLYNFDPNIQYKKKISRKIYFLTLRTKVISLNAV